MRYRPNCYVRFLIDTGGGNDLCLFWERAQENLGRSGQSEPFAHNWGPSSKSSIAYHFHSCFFFQKGHLRPIIVCHIGVCIAIRTKVVLSALRMLAL